MPDTKTTALTAATSWASGDLLYMVSDPAGTPASRKITLDNVLSKIVCAANAKAIGVTGYSLTGTDATSMVDLAGTWNTTGIPTALKVAITNTASGTRSLLASFAATSLGSFEFEKTGELLIGWDGSAGSRTGMKGVHGVSGGVMHFGCTNGGAYIGNTANLGASARVDNSFIKIRSDMSFAWSVDTTSYGATSLALAYDAANTLAQRNGTNAQTLNVYGTWTSVSVFERMFMRYSSGNTRYEIGTETTGGTAKDLEIMVPSTKIVGMDKTTEDNGFINFKATADADATSAISTLTTSGAVTHHIQVKINGVKAWIPCSTTNPS